MKRPLFQYHPVIGYTYIPNLKLRVDNPVSPYLLKTNNSGFRSDIEFKNGRESDNKKILFFGDSFLAGDYVSNGKRFTDILGRDHKKIICYNYGLPGSGTDQHYLIFQEFAETIDFDYLVICIFIENITRITARYKKYTSAMHGTSKIMQKPYFEISNGTLVLNNVPVRRGTVNIEDIPAADKGRIHGLGNKGHIYNVLKQSIGKSNIEKMQKLLNYHHYPQYDRPTNSAWLLMKTILSKWIIGINKPVGILLLPSHNNYLGYDSPVNYQTRFNELQNEINVDILDPLHEMLKLPFSKRKLFRFTNDPHPTKIKHQFIANFLEKIMIRKIF